MDDINILTSYLSHRASCSLCDNTADDVYVVEMQNTDKLTYPVCNECRDYIQVPDNEYIPIFCVKCANAGWMLRNGKVSVEKGMSAVFVVGCPKCSEIAEKVWAL